MKRFLASLLVVFMLVSLLPLSAFAAETKTATVADTQEPAQIVAQQLVLGDNLNMRFCVKANMDHAAINVTIGSGETKSIALTEQDANGNYIINVALAAAQMADTITLQAEANGVTDVGGDAFSGTKWLNDQPDGVVYVGKVADVGKNGSGFGCCN